MSNAGTPTAHVGNRIRLYRKKSGYTLLEFSHMIHRSVSAISKYETGMVSIDIDTLYEIAEALEVSVAQLLDYTPQVKQKEKDQGSKNFFKKTNFYYMYQYSGFDRRTHKCIIEIIPEDEGDDTVMLYYGAKSTEDYTKCDFLYRGKITYNETYAHIHAANPYNDADTVSIYAKALATQRSTATPGLILTLADSLHNPYAAKVVISTVPKEPDAKLLNELMISDRDTLAEIKKSNAMVIY